MSVDFTITTADDKQVVIDSKLAFKMSGLFSTMCDVNEINDEIIDNIKISFVSKEALDIFIEFYKYYFEQAEAHALLHNQPIDESTYELELNEPVRGPDVDGMFSYPEKPRDQWYIDFLNKHFLKKDCKNNYLDHDKYFEFESYAKYLQCNHFYELLACRRTCDWFTAEKISREEFAFTVLRLKSIYTEEEVEKMKKDPKNQWALRG